MGKKIIQGDVDIVNSGETNFVVANPGGVIHASFYSDGGCTELKTRSLFDIVGLVSNESEDGTYDHNYEDWRLSVCKISDKNCIDISSNAMALNICNGYEAGMYIEGGENGHVKLQNLADPQNQLDAATKKYVDIVNLENQANTNERFRQLYDLLQLIDITTTETAEETFKGVMVTVPETLTMDDGWTYKIIDGAGARINEFKGNTWTKNQLCTPFNSGNWFTVGVGGTLSEKTENSILFTRSQNVIEDNVTILYQTASVFPVTKGNKYILKVDLTASSNIKVKLYCGGYTNKDYDLVANQKLHCEEIIPATSSSYPLIIIEHSMPIELGGTVLVENFKGVDLTKMFGPGNEPATVEEFNRLTANINFDDYDSGTIVNTNISELKSYSQYVSYTFTGGENWVTWGSGKRARIPDISVSVLYPTSGKCDNIDWIANRGSIYSGENLDGISNTHIDGVTNFVVGGNVNTTKLVGKTIYYQPANPTDAELLGTYPLTIPPLNGIGTAQDTINKNGYDKWVNNVDLGTLDYDNPVISSDETVVRVNATIKNMKELSESVVVGKDLQIANSAIGQNSGVNLLSTKTYKNIVYINLPIDKLGWDKTSAIKPLVQTYLSGVILYYELAQPLEYDRDGMIKVDLATLDWKQQSDKYFYATFNGAKAGTDNYGCEIICSIYDRQDAFKIYNGEVDKAIVLNASFTGQNKIIIRDTSCPDVPSLLAKINGVILKYEPDEAPTTNTYFDPLLIPIETNGSIIFRSKAAPETTIEFAIGEGI